MSHHDRQSAVLDALARSSAPLTLRELQGALPHLGMTAILRALDALEDRGLTTSSGNRAWVFVDDPAAWDGPPFGPDEVVRFALAA